MVVPPVSAQVEPCTLVPFFDRHLGIWCVHVMSLLLAAFGALRYVLRGHSMLLKIEHACKLSNCDVSKYLDPVAPEQGETADKWEAVYVPFKDTKKKTRTEIKIHAAHVAASLGSTSVLQWLVDHCSPDVLCYQSILGTVCEDTGATFEPRTVTFSNCGSVPSSKSQNDDSYHNKGLQWSLVTWNILKLSAYDCLWRCECNSGGLNCDGHAA